MSIHMEPARFHVYRHTPTQSRLNRIFLAIYGVRRTIVDQNAPPPCVTYRGDSSPIVRWPISSRRQNRLSSSKTIVRNRRFDDGCLLRSCSVVTVRGNEPLRRDSRGKHPVRTKVGNLRPIFLVRLWRVMGSWAFHCTRSVELSTPVGTYSIDHRL